MDLMTIIALVAKGLGVVTALAEAGKNVVPAVTAIKNLVNSTKDGTVTDAEVDATDAQLDAMLTKFDLPLVR